MSKQPYIYTLPEQFMQDTAVPMHWKLYALINGFWIGGKPVFASNKFFAEKLGCSERYVRECLEKLEDLGVVQREGRSQNRRIVPMQREEQGGTNSSAQGGTGSSVREELVVPHISVSNSDNITSSVPLRIEKDSFNTEGTIKEKKDVSYRKVFALFPKPQKSWERNKTQITAAKALLEEKGIEKIRGALRFAVDYQDKQFCPSVFSPYDLDTKWNKLWNYKQKV